MPVHRLVRQHQFGGDRVIGLAGREEPEHLELPRGEPARGAAAGPPLRLSTLARSGAAPSRPNAACGVELECRRRRRHRGRGRPGRGGPALGRPRREPRGLPACRALRRRPRAAVGRPRRGEPRPRRNRPRRRRAWSGSAYRSSSAAADRAAVTSPAASMISTWAGRSLARRRRTVVCATDRRIVAGCATIALRKPQQGPSRLRVMPPTGRFPVASRPRRAHPGAGQFRLTVQGGSGGVPVRRPGQPSRARSVSSRAAGQAPCCCRISARCTRHCPVNVTMSGCSAHQASSAAVHSRCPAQVGDLLAGVDHRAVEVAGDRRPHLARRRPRPSPRPAAPCPRAPGPLDEGSPVEVRAERQQVGVTDPCPDVGSAGGRGPGRS